MCQSIMLCTVLSVNYISIKLGKKERMEEGGNVAKQQWAWAH